MTEWNEKNRIDPQSKVRFLYMFFILVNKSDMRQPFELAEARAGDWIAWWIW
jgi:hypothetical protein